MTALSDNTIIFLCTSFALFINETITVDIIVKNDHITMSIHVSSELRMPIYLP